MRRLEAYGNISPVSVAPARIPRDVRMIHHRERWRSASKRDHDVFRIHAQLDDFRATFRRTGVPPARPMYTNAATTLAGFLEHWVAANSVTRHFEHRQERN